jgi:hypothetical protein
MYTFRYDLLLHQISLISRNGLSVIEWKVKMETNYTKGHGIIDIRFPETT